MDGAIEQKERGSLKHSEYTLDERHRLVVLTTICEAVQSMVLRIKNGYILLLSISTKSPFAFSKAPTDSLARPPYPQVKND